MNPTSNHEFHARNAGRTLQQMCHDAAFASGWWTDKTGRDLRYVMTSDPWAEQDEPTRTTASVAFNVPEKLMLIVSEVAEAMEGFRKGLKDDKLPARDMLEVELADAVIRIFDLAGGLNYDLGPAIAEKLEYNRTRADHKPENRNAPGGKAF